MVKIPVEMSRGKKDQGLHSEETIVTVSKELRKGLGDIFVSLYLGLGHQMNIFCEGLLDKISKFCTCANDFVNFRLLCEREK
jgi:hypothetical protein